MTVLVLLTAENYVMQVPFHDRAFAFDTRQFSSSVVLYSVVP